MPGIRLSFFNRPKFIYTDSPVVASSLNNHVNYYYIKVGL